MAVQAPPIEIIRPWFPVLLPFVQAVRVLLGEYPGLVPSSWWRSNADNRRVGGNSQSQHLLGLGADLDWSRLNSAQRIQATARARQLRLVPVTYNRHVHVQFFRAGVLGRAGVRFDLLP